MTSGLDPLRLDRLLTGRFGRPLKHLVATASTQTVALKWAASGAPEGAVVAADHQTAGRGRWGRPWHSAPGALIQFSVVLRPRLEASRLGLLSIATGVGCCEAMRACGLEASLKWPNDVNVSGRKLAGMLIETQSAGPRIAAAVAGIGINYRWLPEDMPEDISESATSMAAECSARGLPLPGREEVLASVLRSLEDAYDTLSENPDGLVAEASERSEVLGREVLVWTPGEDSYSGTARRILADGALEITTSSGPIRLEMGEITRLREA